MNQSTGFRADDPEYNPFAAPLEQSYALPTEYGHAERIRRELLSHEASIQSIGGLYLLGSVLVIVGVCFLAVVLIGSLSLPRGRQLDPTFPFMWAILLVLGVLQFWVGLGLRRLQAWTRIPVGILSTIGLLAFPLGTVVNAYILHLMFSSKGSRVLSPEYQEIIRQTPHIKYKTSLVLKIFVGLLLFVVAMIIIGVLLS